MPEDLQPVLTFIGILISLAMLVWHFMSRYPQQAEPDNEPAVSALGATIVDDTDLAVANEMLEEISAQPAYVPPPVSAERQAQLDLQAQMTAAMQSGGDPRQPGGGTNLVQRVDRGYDYRDDLADKSHLIEPDEDQSRMRTAPLAFVGVAPGDIPEHIRDCPLHDPAFWERAARKQHNTFGGKLDRCGDLKLKIVYDWFVRNLSEGERQDLYAAGGMKACDEACIQMARYVLGYDRPWWKRLLGLGMPRKRDLPPGLQKLV